MQFTVSETTNPQSNRYILLADDDEDDRLMMSVFFGANRYDYHIFSSGKDALHFLEHLCSENLPSVIMLDYSMPFYSGEEVLQRLKASEVYKHIPVIVYSTEMSESRKHQLASLGAAACFAKAIHYNEQDEMKKVIDCFLKSTRNCVWTAGPQFKSILL